MNANPVAKMKVGMENSVFVGQDTTKLKASAKPVTLTLTIMESSVFAIMGTSVMEKRNVPSAMKHVGNVQDLGPKIALPVLMSAMI